MLGDLFPQVGPIHFCTTRHTGLKTTYYLRTLQASNIEKSTISVKKEARGAAGATAATGAVSEQKKEYTAAEQQACSIDAMINGGECEACQ